MQARGHLSQMSEHPVLDTAIWTGDGQAVNSFHPLHEPARLPADEEGRARAVSTLQLHDRTSNDSHIDTLVLVTQRAFREVGDRSENVPTLSAAVNILDRTTQRTTASAGFEFGVVDRDVSLCAHTILDQHLRANTLGCLVVLDTADDPRFKYRFDTAACCLCGGQWLQGGVACCQKQPC